MENINEELNYMKYLFGYKKGIVISEQTGPNEPTDTSSNQPTPSAPAEPSQQELEKQRTELEQKLNSINSNLDKLKLSSESQEKLRVEQQIMSQITEIDKFLKQSCVKRMTRLCKQYQLEKNALNSQISQLRNLSTTPVDKSMGQSQPQSASEKATAWVGVASSILNIVTPFLALFKKDKDDNNDGQ